MPVADAAACCPSCRSGNGDGIQEVLVASSDAALVLPDDNVAPSYARTSDECEQRQLCAWLQGRAEWLLRFPRRYLK